MEDNKISKSQIKIMIKNNIRQYTMFIALISIMLIFSVIESKFLSPRNISTLFLQTGYIAILTCGVVLIIVAGHIDLSIGAVVGLTGAIAARLMVTMGLPMWLAIILTLVAGLIIGIWQGAWVAYGNVPGFIVTLAGMLIFNGLLLLVTKGGVTINFPQEFKLIGQGYIPTLFMENNVKDMIPHDTTMIILVLSLVGFVLFEMKKRADRKKYNFHVLSTKLFIAKLFGVSALISAVLGVMALYKGMPYSILIVIIIAGFYTFLTNNTAFGRHVYAIGGNKEAAKLSGINIKLRTLMIFASMGVLSAAGGIVYGARVGSASSSAGAGMELDVIAAAIIGGTSTMGGEGTIIGAVIGALVMGTLENGLLLVGVSTEARMIIKGLVLLLAVFVDIKTRKNKS
ncbi:MAG: sugar ABC transporter permease [Firmicutes bacterium HGW-Firmicutes-1]|jgi:D-xylose transport system permease protein|nr:MAG: sugar ABC transporter permease [Firmicutes bacterium HGW-Firmicutes-1]